MAAPKNLQEFCEKFEKIKSMKWITTHRAGPTGIGKTLEDLLDIEENNIDGPDFGDYELKAMRTNASSMLTLFSKTPSPSGINKVLLNEYGIVTHANGEKTLLTTLVSTRLSRIGDSGKSLGLKIEQNKIDIIDDKNTVVAYWSKEDLNAAFLKKYKYRLVHVYADSLGSGSDEQFYFHTAHELYGFSFEGFVNMLKEGLIAVDIRIGQYPDGRPHDRGTAFRIQERNLPALFSSKNILVDGE